MTRSRGVSKNCFWQDEEVFGALNNMLVVGRGQHGWKVADVVAEYPPGRRAMLREGSGPVQSAFFFLPTAD